MVFNFLKSTNGYFYRLILILQNKKANCCTTIGVELKLDGGGGQQSSFSIPFILTLLRWLYLPTKLDIRVFSGSSCCMAILLRRNSPALKLKRSFACFLMLNDNLTFQLTAHYILSKSISYCINRFYVRMSKLRLDLI